MTWFQNLSIRWKLVIPLAVIAMLIVLLSVRSQYSTELQAKAVGIVIDVDIPALNLVQQADRDFHQVWVAERSMLTLKVGSDDYKAMQVMHTENIAQIAERMKKVASLDTSDEIAGLLTLFWQDFPKWQEITKRVVMERTSNTRAGRSSAIGLSYKESADLFNLTRGYLDQIADLTIALSKSRATQLGEMHKNARIEGMMLLGVVLVICLGIAIIFPLLITKDLQQIIERIKQLAQGGGDLTRRMNMNRRDELGQLGSNLDQFIGELNSLIKEVINNASESAKSVKRLTELADDAKSFAERQSLSVEGVFSSTTKITDSIHDIAKNTQEAAESTRNANQEAKKGELQVENTKGNIEALTTSVQEVVAAISRIEEVTVKVGSVLSVISGIAEQTNLLALNAAIEAARAGEQGRGFAVVADEVRALAGKTQDSTDSVREMLNSLEQRVKEAVSIMNSATENANRTIESSDQTSSVMSSMIEAMSMVNQLMKHIADVTEQQNDVAQDIKENIGEIQGLSNDNKRQVASVDESCQFINGLQVKLQDITSKFTV